MRLVPVFYLIFSFSVAVNALEVRAWFDTALVDAGAALKDTRAGVSKFIEGVGSEASKAAQTVGAFIDEQVQVIGKEAGFERLAAIKEAMSRVVVLANEFQRHLDEHDINTEDFGKRLSDALAPHYADISKDVEDNALVSREDKFELALQHTGQALLFVGNSYDFPEDETQSFWEKLARALLHLLKLIAQLINDHPWLIANVLFYIAWLCLQGYVPLFLRIILSYFGFGAQGPIRGTLASWAQSYFWGAAVNSGSWFAWMQRAAMVVKTGEGLGSLYAGAVSAVAGLGVLFGFNGTEPASGD